MRQPLLYLYDNNALSPRGSSDAVPGKPAVNAPVL